MGREGGGWAEGIGFEDNDVAAELQGGHRGHAGQLAAADDAQARAGGGFVFEDFRVVDLVHACAGSGWDVEW